MRTRSVGLGPCVYGNLVYGTVAVYLTDDDAAPAPGGGGRRFLIWRNKWSGPFRIFFIIKKLL